MNRWDESSRSIEARLGAAVMRSNAANWHRAGAVMVQVMQRAMLELEPAIRAAAEAMAAASLAMLGSSFSAQRLTVDVLLAAPWYRHLRIRWSLRHAPSWSTIYPPLEEPR